MQVEAGGKGGIARCHVKGEARGQLTCPLSKARPEMPLVHFFDNLKKYFQALKYLHGVGSGIGIVLEPSYFTLEPSFIHHTWSVFDRMVTESS